MEAGDDAPRRDGGTEPRAAVEIAGSEAPTQSASDQGDAAGRLVSYREQVIEELERRVLRVAELERVVAAVHHQLDEVRHGRRPCAGETSTVVVRAAYTARLKRQLAMARREQDQAQQDVQRAEDRLQEVDAQLEELNQGMELDHTEADASAQVDSCEPDKGE